MGYSPNDPFLGLGIAGDEVVIQELAHSMYLSIFVTYGMILGSLVILYLFSQTIMVFVEHPA